MENRQAESKRKLVSILLSSLILLFLFLLSVTGCGSRKTQVQTPKSPHPSSSPAVIKDSGGQSDTAAVKFPAQTKEAIEPVMGTPPSPSIRIGLITAAKEVRVSSSDDFYFSEKIPEASRQLLKREALIRVEQEAKPEAKLAFQFYRVQVASFIKPEAAEELRKKLVEKLSMPVIVYENKSLARYQVQAGEFLKLEDARAFATGTLADMGYRDAFVVRQPASDGKGKGVLALRGPENLFRLTQAGYLISPSSSTSYLQVNGKPYRGFLDIILNANGNITVINQLGLEEYLLGVVPAEISPTRYPEFAALAAQAIAARTYALKNMGRYRSEGYDLTADARTQVYGGVAEEKEATNKAVQQTFGLAIYYQDKIIDAMYTSTCGGRTEDASNVFGGPSVPYLTSVFCAVEGGSGHGTDTAIEGYHNPEEVIFADDGSLANRNLELARVLGIIEPHIEILSEYLSHAPDRNEIVKWINKAQRLIQGSSAKESSLNGDIGTRSEFLSYASESFFGAAEIRRNISDSDADYYISNLKDGYAVPESARYALAYLMKKGLWRPYPDNTARPDVPVRRVDALFLLLRWIESVQPEILRKGIFMGPGTSAEINNAIAVKWGNGMLDFPLSKKLSLFRLDSGQIMPVSSLHIIGNEKLSFHLNQNGEIDFLEVELNPNGAASDRYSHVAAWDVKLSRSEVADKLSTLAGNIGEIIDLRPSRFGNSGRAVEIKIIGSHSSVVLNGFKVRNALGLKDTLFTISRVQNPDGSIDSFFFRGRGWGHGVGLCQVGAFGMARAGRSFEEILKTYYQGVQIRKAY